MSDTKKLLQNLADALNACSSAGLRVKLKHNAVYTREGYVLPVEDDRWVARTLLYTELTPADDHDEED